MTTSHHNLDTIDQVVETIEQAKEKVEEDRRKIFISLSVNFAAEYDGAKAWRKSQLSVNG